MKKPPPLKDEMEGQVCGYQPGDVDTRCLEPASRHFLWDRETMENGFACKHHVSMIEFAYHYDLKHNVGPDCGMPSSWWMFDENICIVTWDTEDLVAEKKEVLDPSTV